MVLNQVNCIWMMMSSIWPGKSLYILLLYFLTANVIVTTITLSVRATHLRQDWYSAADTLWIVILSVLNWIELYGQLKVSQSATVVSHRLNLNTNIVISWIVLLFLTSEQVAEWALLYHIIDFFSVIVIEVIQHFISHKKCGGVHASSASGNVPYSNDYFVFPSMCL